MLFQEWELKKMSRGNLNSKQSSKCVYDERVFANGGASVAADSETEEEYFKRMHEFNKATGASYIWNWAFLIHHKVIIFLL